MTVAFTRKTAPTLVESEQNLKQFARITQDNEDGLALSWWAAAVAYLERVTARGFLTQTWQVSLSELPSVFQLPYAAPLQSITHVKYYDANNTLQTWASSNYYTPAFHEPATVAITQDAVLPTVYGREDAWLIEYVVGWTAVEDLPEPLQLALRMLVTYWSDNREAAIVGQVSSEIDFSVTALVSPYRVWWTPPC